MSSAFLVVLNSFNVIYIGAALQGFREANLSFDYIERKEFLFPRMLLS